MSEINASVSITPEAIEAAIVNAVISAGIGKQIAKAVEDYKNKFNADYVFKNAIDEEIKRVVSQIISAEVNSPERREVIRATVNEKMTDEVLGAMVSKFWSDRGRW